MTKVLVGLSGGVDSSVAAALLVEQGYEVAGVYMEAYNEPGCRTDQDKKDALQVALKLGIKYQTLDVREQYKKLVIQYFVDEYMAGRTPNPDIVCNREIKFGLLYDYMKKHGFDYLATGHYARIASYKAWPCKVLQRPRDLSKDQTYFLWQVGQDKLEHVLFPLGEMLKSQVRTKAKECKLSNAEKPDSMGVCMMGELNVTQFLREKLGENPGKVIWKGKVVGEHWGLWFSTIGQRGGWEISPDKQTPQMPALYVIGKDRANNQLMVGVREECFVKKLIIRNLELRIKAKKLWVRIRNLGELVEIVQCSMVNGQWSINTEKPIFAPAPGQSAVFYDKEGRVVGGGVIEDLQ